MTNIATRYATFLYIYIYIGTEQYLEIYIYMYISENLILSILLFKSMDVTIVYAQDVSNTGYQIYFFVVIHWIALE